MLFPWNCPVELSMFGLLGNDIGEDDYWSAASIFLFSRSADECTLARRNKASNG